MDKVYISRDRKDLKWSLFKSELGDFSRRSNVRLCWSSSNDECRWKLCGGRFGGGLCQFCCTQREKEAVEPIIAAGTTSYHLEFLVTSLTSVVITLHLRFTRQQISDFPPWNWACPQGPSSSVSSLNFPFSGVRPLPWARCSPPPGIEPSSQSGFPSVGELRGTSLPPHCFYTSSPNTYCSSAHLGQTAFFAFE